MKKWIFIVLCLSLTACSKSGEGASDSSSQAPSSPSSPNVPSSFNNLTTGLLIRTDCELQGGFTGRRHYFTKLSSDTFYYEYDDFDTGDSDINNGCVLNKQVTKSERIKFKILGYTSHAGYDDLTIAIQSHEIMPLNQTWTDYFNNSSDFTGATFQIGSYTHILGIGTNPSAGTQSQQHFYFSGGVVSFLGYTFQ